MISIGIAKNLSGILHPPIMKRRARSLVRINPDGTIADEPDNYLHGQESAFHFRTGRLRKRRRLAPS
jgi:hypothetical protein